MSDLITEDRTILRWSQARDKHQLSNKDVMKWLGVIESIPRDWESFIKNDSNGLNRTYSISNDTRVSRIAYTLLAKSQLLKSPHQNY